MPVDGYFVHVRLSHAKRLRRNGREKILEPSRSYISARLRAVYRGAPVVFGMVRPRARIPPVDVPATRSKRCAVGRPVRRSISASTMAGMIPRMPPPSMDRILTMVSINRRRTDHGARPSSPQEQTAARALPPSPKARVGLVRHDGGGGSAQLTRTEGEIIRKLRRPRN